MKLQAIVFVFFTMAFAIATAQENKTTPKGDVIGKVYFNYHLNTTKDATQKSAFELNRAYFGYKYTFDDKFSAQILLDAGKNVGGSAYTVFIKNAKLDYKANDWLTLTAGVFGLKQFSDQEKFWGYRYVYKSFDDLYRLGSSADLGVMAAFKIRENLQLDLLIVNGEGYTNLQDQTGNNRYGINVVFNPIKNLTLKGYFDLMKAGDDIIPNQETTITNLALFAGYQMDAIFKIGAEYNLMKNGTTFRIAADGRDLDGFSFYGTYFINEKWNVFGRYDMLSSNTLTNETTPWNNLENGDTFIGGFEYKPMKNINTSINYRNYNFSDESIKNHSFVYVNLEFYF
jgi:hypothetical protein